MNAALGGTLAAFSNDLVATIDAVAPARTVPALAPVTLNTEPLAMLAEYVIGAGPVFVNEYV